MAHRHLLRTVLFRTHWLLGIFAGVVLAVVGFTGAMLSFEHELLRAMNPGVLSVEPRGTALSTAELLARVAEQRPGEAIASLARASEPAEPAVIGFAPKADAPPGPGGRPRGETRRVDPYDGTLLGELRGEGFFRTTMQLHRWLLADANSIGKQIVGAANAALLVFALTGIYLRWPKGRWTSPRAWLAINLRKRGRTLLWQLHTVVATWLLPIYVVIALTGMWWSYESYRTALQAWAGIEVPAAPGGAQAAGAPDGARGKSPGGGDRGGGADGAPVATAPPAFDAVAAWAAFERAVPAWSEATLRWPGPDGKVAVRYFDADPAHERAANTLELDAATLATIRHDRYADASLKKRLVTSVFALHRGSFFGVAGVLAWMLASLAMPLFAVTGYWLWYERRRLANRQPRRPVAVATPAREHA
jgi:sulfite reductase (NADPH) flavoprotein alpha-component